MINIAKKLFTVIQIFKLLHVLILWITSQKNISALCPFAGLEQMKVLGYISPLLVCHCAFTMDKVRSEGLGIPSFSGRKRVVYLPMFVVKKLIPE